MHGEVQQKDNKLSIRNANKFGKPMQDNIVNFFFLPLYFYSGSWGGEKEGNYTLLNLVLDSYINTQ
jgi:hypothetical protein